MKRVLILVNHDMSLYTFRLEIIERLLDEGHEVHVSSPRGEYLDKIRERGVICHETSFERHGKNIVDEFRLLNTYKRIMRSIKPDIVFGYTIKPNIYGAIAARNLNIPFVANITGLGTAVETPGLTQRILLQLYKFAFKNVKKIFFQNEENRNFFERHGIAKGKYDMLPGSGVNLKKFSYCEYPNDSKIKFAFISRIMKEKGIDHYLEAANSIKKKYDNVEFHVCGFCEPNYTGPLEKAINDDTVIYHGLIDNVPEFMKDVHAIVHPTYYPEGMSNVLLEGCATGRPIITTNRSGCKEIVDDGWNGYMILPQNTEELVRAIEKFIALTWEEKKCLGVNARTKVENQFDRTFVVEKYIKEVNSL